MHVNKVKDWGSDGSQRDKGIPLVASKATLKILLSKVAKSKSTSTTVSRNGQSVEVTKVDALEGMCFAWMGNIVLDRVVHNTDMKAPFDSQDTYFFNAFFEAIKGVGGEDAAKAWKGVLEIFDSIGWEVNIDGARDWDGADGEEGEAAGGTDSGDEEESAEESGANEDDNEK